MGKLELSFLKCLLKEGGRGVDEVIGGADYEV